LLVAQGNLDEAIEMYRQCLYLPQLSGSIYVHPNVDAMAYNNLGVVFQMQGKLEEAIDAYQLALLRSPGYFRAIENLENAKQLMDRR
jgi:tetratricopeptide (TPR) repeat protein